MSKPRKFVHQKQQWRKVEKKREPYITLVGDDDCHRFIFYMRDFETKKKLITWWNSQKPSTLKVVDIYLKLYDLESKKVIVIRIAQMNEKKPKKNEIALKIQDYEKLSNFWTTKNLITKKILFVNPFTDEIIGGQNIVDHSQAFD